MGRIAGEHGKQLLAAGRELGNGRAQRRAPFGGEDFLIDHYVVYGLWRVSEARVQSFRSTHLQYEEALLLGKCDTRSHAVSGCVDWRAS